MINISKSRIQKLIERLQELHEHDVGSAVPDVSPTVQHALSKQLSVFQEYVNTCKARAGAYSNSSGSYNAVEGKLGKDPTAELVVAIYSRVADELQSAINQAKEKSTEYGNFMDNRSGVDRRQFPRDQEDRRAG